MQFKISPLFFYIGTKVLFLCSTDIHWFLRYLVNNLVSHTTPFSPIHFQTSIGITSGPTDFPVLNFKNAFFISDSMFLQQYKISLGKYLTSSLKPQTGFHYVVCQSSFYHFSIISSSMRALLSSVLIPFISPFSSTK